MRIITRHSSLVLAAVVEASLALACSSSPSAATPAPATAPPSNGTNDAGVDGAAPTADAGTTTAKSTLTRQTSVEVPAADTAELVTGNTAFAFDLYPSVLKATTGPNAVYSPYSISLALAMTYAGANGTTATQMANALHFTLPPQRLNPAFNALDASLTSGGTANFQLHVADSLWSDVSLPLLPSYLDTLATNYGAGVNVVDFVSAPGAAVSAMNQWVSQATNGEIPKLLDAIPAGTLFTLFNAVYFDAKWTTPFDKGATSPSAFTRPDGSTVNPATMGGQAQLLSYAETDDYQAIDLGYESGTAAMTVVLPQNGKDAAVVSALNGDWYTALVQSYTQQLVSLRLPKFNVQPPAFSVQAALAGLGMTDAFDSSADFSKLSSRPMQLLGVAHQALVRVDEDGTVAAAATAVIGGTTGVAANPKTMTVNRPFFFFIRAIPSNTILFVGRVTDPTPP